MKSLNLGSNKISPKGVARLFEALASNTHVPISTLILNNNDLEITRKTATPSVYFSFTKSIVTYLS